MPVATRERTRVFIFLPLQRASLDALLLLVQCIGAEGLRGICGYRRAAPADLTEIISG